MNVLKLGFTHCIVTLSLLVSTAGIGLSLPGSDHQDFEVVAACLQALDASDPAVAKARAGLERIKARHQDLLDKTLWDDVVPNARSRRWLDEWLPEHFNQLRFKNIAIMVADIDYFKRVNDTYGHTIGDNLLRQFGMFVEEYFSHELRQDDFYMARFGGDEFIFVTRNIPVERLSQLARDFVKQFNEQKMFLDSAEKLSTEALQSEHQMETTKLSLSLGVYSQSVTPKNYSAEDAQALTKAVFKKADELLYVSKNSGRNQVTISWK